MKINKLTQTQKKIKGMLSSMMKSKDRENLQLFTSINKKYTMISKD